MNQLKILLFTMLVVLTQTSSAKQSTILVMGDSLSAGYGINVQDGWVNLLQQELAKNASAKIINASVSGETTSGGLTRLPTLLTKHHPDIVILELGGNDGLRGQPLNIMEKNLQAMIDASIAINAKIILAGMQIPTNYGPRYTKQFKEIYPSLAEKNNIALIPFLLEGVATNVDLIQSDRIHPTAEAQPTIMKNVLPVLTPLLK